jgi:predicted transglutaminase-like cysteine proteinase
MRKIAKFLAAAAATMIVGVLPQAQAGLVGGPLSLRGAVQFIKFDTPTLAPMAFTMFCMRYADECKPHRIAFRGGRVKLTPERWQELKDVNRSVNAAIKPEANLEGLAGEKWLLHPAKGDCNDFAVTTTWGEHHLVVVVRMFNGDLVLDNLTQEIVPWSRKPYRWVRIQMPKNPNYWASLSERRI